MLLQKYNFFTTFPSFTPTYLVMKTEGTEYKLQTCMKKNACKSTHIKTKMKTKRS